MVLGHALGNIFHKHSFWKATGNICQIGVGFPRVCASRQKARFEEVLYTQQQLPANLLH